MTRLYVILAGIGWAWLVVVAVVLTVKLRRGGTRPPAQRGFDAVEPPAAEAPGAAPAAGPATEA
jgi:hypothetical protein